MAGSRIPAVSVARGRRWPHLSALAAASVLLLAACGGDEPETEAEAPQTEADESLAAMVPDDIREAGTVTVGVNAEYPPGEFLDTDGETVVGFNVDLFDAAAGKLGLETQWEPAPFDSIITRVMSGQYDVGVSSFTINQERLEQVNMVSYFTAGTQWFAAEGNPENVDPENACGHRVAVERATVQVEDIEARSEACVEAGEPEIVIEQFQSQELATASVVEGVNDAGLADLPVALYAVQQTNGQLETIGEQYEDAPYGAVVHLDQTEFAEAIAAGYQAIMDDGTYEEILAEWDAEEGAITEAQVNPSVDE